MSVLNNPIPLHFGRFLHFWFVRCSLKFFLLSMSNFSTGQYVQFPLFCTCFLFCKSELSFLSSHIFHFSCSLLLRRECCSFSNGEYVKAGLAELEHWCFKATDEVHCFTLLLYFVILAIMYEHYVLTPLLGKIAVCRFILG